MLAENRRGITLNTLNLPDFRSAAAKKRQLQLVQLRSLNLLPTNLFIRCRTQSFPFLSVERWYEGELRTEICWEKEVAEG